MTPEQVAIVQSSFKGLGPQTNQLAGKFYERLFEVAPELRTMFPEDAAAQEAVFVAELGEIVHCIPRFDAFMARTRDLGARHAAFGVTYAHYETVGDVLLEALADRMGPAFTDEVQEAWRLAFDLMAETMMQGAADAMPQP